MSARSGHPLDTFDALLAEHKPFGDSGYLREQLEVRYIQRLEKLASPIPIAGELVRALGDTPAHARYRILGDPVVRHAIQQALRQVVRGTQDGMPLADCEEVFRGAIRQLQEGKGIPPLEAGLPGASRLGTGSFDGWIWSEAHDDDVFGRTFRTLLRDHFRGEQLCTPSAEDATRLAKGAELLGELLPLSARGALSHAHVVVPFVGQKASYSEFRVCGTVGINREMLHNPWWVAEHLLHEALHHKLYDFRHTHSLLARDLSPGANTSTAKAATVYSIWNVGGAGGENRWDTFRAVAAFHVYVHLALLCLQAERRKAELVGRFGSPSEPLPGFLFWRDAFERAQYLGREIRGSCWHELGPAGRLLIDWLSSILGKLDVAPPPSDSVYLRLLLERYVIEASRLAGRKLSPEGTAELAKLVREEEETLRRVLSATSAGPVEFDRLSEASDPRPEEGAEGVFFRFRSQAAKTLRSLSPDGYGLRSPSGGDSSALEEMIQKMMERSSERLIPLLDG
jgi:hypothetical protein